MDGAILANNPSTVALAEAELLFPGRPVECLVSLGTHIPPSRRRSGRRRSGRRPFDMCISRMRAAIRHCATRVRRHRRPAAAAERREQRDRVAQSRAGCGHELAHIAQGRLHAAWAAVRSDMRFRQSTYAYPHARSPVCISHLGHPFDILCSPVCVT